LFVVPVQVIAWITISKKTYNVSSGTLNLTHSLTHSVLRNVAVLAMLGLSSSSSFIMQEAAHKIHTHKKTNIKNILQ